MGRRRRRGIRGAVTARRPESWRDLLGPLALIGVMGAVCILFLHCCARKSQLETQVRQEGQKVEVLRAQQQALYAEIGLRRDPTRLRSWAGQQGMVFAATGVDRVRLSRALPPQQVAANPLGVPQENGVTAGLHPASGTIAQAANSKAGD